MNVLCLTTNVPESSVAVGVPVVGTLDGYAVELALVVIDGEAGAARTGKTCGGAGWVIVVTAGVEV